MGKKDYQINTAIEVTYQATGAATGLEDVIMEIYDETGAHVASGGDFDDVTMTEIGSTGRYKGSFTPDAKGKWRIMINSIGKPGKYVKDYGVGGYDVDAVGDAVAVVDGIADDIKAKTENLPVSPASSGNVSAVGDAVSTVNSAMAKDSTVAKAGQDGDTLKSLSDQIDALSETGPIVG